MPVKCYDVKIGRSYTTMIGGKIEVVEITGKLPGCWEATTADGRRVAVTSFKLTELKEPSHELHRQGNDWA